MVFSVDSCCSDGHAAERLVLPIGSYVGMVGSGESMSGICFISELPLIYHVQPLSSIAVHVYQYLRPLPGVGQESPAGPKDSQNLFHLSSNAFISIVAAGVLLAATTLTLRMIPSGLLLMVASSSMWIILGASATEDTSIVTQTSQTLSTLSLHLSIAWSVGLLVVWPQGRLSLVYVLVLSLVQVPRFVVGVMLCCDGVAPLAATADVVAVLLVQAMHVGFNRPGLGLSLAIVSLVCGLCIIVYAHLTTKSASRSWWSCCLLYSLLLLPVMVRHEEIRQLLPGTRLGQGLGPDSEADLSVHPILRLVEHHHVKYEAMVNRQSKTLPEAVEEYQRRYHRRPPPKFDQWFALAQEHSLVLVDEFDTVMQSLEPFWGIAPAILHSRMDSYSAGGQGNRMVFNSSGIFHQGSKKERAIQGWLSDGLPWQNVISDAQLLVNSLDEPKVSVSYQTLDKALSAAAHQKPGTSSPTLTEEDEDEEISWHNFHGTPAWEFLFDSCPPGLRSNDTDGMIARGKSDNTDNGIPPSGARLDDTHGGVSDSNDTRTIISGGKLDDTSIIISGNGGQLEFLSDPSRDQDPCQNPRLHQRQGLYVSPSNLVLTKHLVPLLTQARPRRFNDILYPAPFYTDTMDQDIKDEDESAWPWAAKHDRVYWVGGSQSGLANMDNWRGLQRAYMTILVSQESGEEVVVLRKAEPHPHAVPQKDSGEPDTQSLSTRASEPSPPSSSSHWWHPISSRWSLLSSLFHIKLSAIKVCGDSCRTQQDYFHPQPEPISESYTSKYVLDLDGNGFSGRFYRLLKSGCAVLKQTMFEEWHDGGGWLEPWVHYIPVSMDAAELGELARFLIQEDQGQEVGRKIAEDGREWSRKVLRRVDLELVFLRLLMEMERILRSDRDELYYQD